MVIVTKYLKYNFPHNMVTILKYFESFKLIFIALRNFFHFVNVVKITINKNFIEFLFIDFRYFIVIQKLIAADT